MRIIYSTQAIVQYDGQHYYSNSVQSTYKRYKGDNDTIVCLCYIKLVTKGTEEQVDDGALEYIEIKKCNTLESLIKYSYKNKRIVEKEVKKADACIAHIPDIHSYWVIDYAKKFCKPYMTVVVGCSWDSMWNYNWKGKLLAPFCYYLQKRAQEDVPFSIYVTNSFLQNRYPTSGKCIGCSNVNIHTGVKEVLQKRLDQLENRELNHKILKIGTAAALDVPYKGQAFVIRALGLLKKEGIKFEYHLVGGGTGEYLKSVAKRANVEDCVHIHGHISHNKIIDFLDDIDIYIQPSKQEGLPRATIEAMSRGCLCIGSNIAGIPELLEPKFLFSKGCVKEIVNILRHVTYNVCKLQAKRNFEFAKRYDCDILNNRRKEFINEFKKTIEY